MAIIQGMDNIELATLQGHEFMKSENVWRKIVAGGEAVGPFLKSVMTLIMGCSAVAVGCRSRSVCTLMSLNT